MKLIESEKTLNKLLMIPTLLALGLVSAGTYANTRIANGDFNGDGYEDMIVGIPGEKLGTIEHAGAVSVFYGTANGLGSEPLQFIHQDTPQSGARAAIPGFAEKFDQFGGTIVAGDFDNDGFDDAAIASAGENDGNGVVHILYGSPRGVHGPHVNVLSAASVAGYPNGKNGNFGRALATGDINKDGYTDLVVGIPFHDGDGIFVNPVDGAGAIMIIYGGANGLNESGTGSQLLFQRYPFIPGNSERFDFFGSSLATDDFDQDGYADIAVGIPNEDLGTVKDAGGVVVLYGSSSGISVVSRPSVFIQDERLDPFDQFGSTLATGDFDGNGYPDLAVGHPFENGPKGENNIGAVTVFFSNAQGAKSGDVKVFTQGSLDIDKDESNDRFGSTLAADDFNGDDIDDLAIGIPFEDQERRFRVDRNDAGRVTVLYGSTSGLKKIAGNNWHQDKAGVRDGRESGDRFGTQLSVGDYNGDGFGDLVVGVPGEDVYVNRAGNAVDAGIVHIFYGQPAGLSTDEKLGQEVFTEPTRVDGNVPGRAEPNDQFGG